jgi:hypothetical protein
MTTMRVKICGLIMETRNIYFSNELLTSVGLHLISNIGLYPQRDVTVKIKSTIYNLKHRHNLEGGGGKGVKCPPPYFFNLGILYFVTELHSGK